MRGQILIGDALHELKNLPDKSVQMCVTSPPYYGLRDYDVNGQIGIESSPEEYVANLVEIFREVRRVLTDDGTLWLNIGDSYAGSRKGQHKGGCADYKNKKTLGMPLKTLPASNLGLKPKDLIGIPWLAAFALRNDGWYLRQEIIWAKGVSGDACNYGWHGNPMPEPVRDRPTRSHEQVFLFSKSARYFYDSDAIAEKAVSADDTVRDRETTKLNNTPGRTKMKGLVTNAYSTRNRRSVWTIKNRPYTGKHFAVFPYDLPEVCILAGTSEKGHCPECGKRRVRNIKRFPMKVLKSERNRHRGTRIGMSGHMASPGYSVADGWLPTCACGCEPVPDIVLDPFGGSGTTTAVAYALGRDFIHIDLHPESKELLEKRKTEIEKKLLRRRA